VNNVSVVLSVQAVDGGPRDFAMVHLLVPQSSASSRRRRSIKFLQDGYLFRLLKNNTTGGDDDIELGTVMAFFIRSSNINYDNDASVSILYLFFNIYFFFSYFLK
jgi:hypothetical protein